MEKVTNKVTEQELTQIKELNSKLQAIQMELGRLELLKSDYLASFREISNQFNEVKTDLTEKYGDISVNIEDGSYELVAKEEE